MEIFNFHLSKIQTKSDIYHQKFLSKLMNEMIDQSTFSTGKNVFLDFRKNTYTHFIKSIHSRYTQNLKLYKLKNRLTSKNKN